MRQLEAQQLPWLYYRPMNSAPRRLAIAVLALFASTNVIAQVLSVDPGKMTSLGTVDERFQSYNIEMVEVTGGRFWKPYSSQAKSASHAPSTPQAAAPIAGLGSDLFEYRSPIDLGNSRLRKLAAALGPTYVRVSGSWANSTYFQDSDDAAPANPPSGFGSVLTRKEWKGVIDFARATDAQLVTSFAISSGTRDANGQWTPEQARKVLAYTKSVGGQIAATEFMNEPNLPSFGGAPKGYDASAYARDLAVFKPFLKQNSPETLLTGPGSTAETPTRPRNPIPGFLTTDALLTATGPAFDVFDYHLYAAVSQRCAQRAPEGQTTAADALSAEWLSRSEKIAAFYGGLGDKYEPGKPIWITETADAACGGNPWASTFLDTFRYLVQHGRLAQMGVKVIMHNTLAASDYGLLDEKTFAPRPNYWAALLWRKLMGTTVLDPHILSPPQADEGSHVLESHPSPKSSASAYSPQPLGSLAVLPFAQQLRSSEAQLAVLDSQHQSPGIPSAGGSNAFSPALETGAEGSFVLPLSLADSRKPTADSRLYAYAHCLESHPGGVAMLLVNPDQRRTYQLNVPTDSGRYTLTAERFFSAVDAALAEGRQPTADSRVDLNGKPLALSSDDDLPQLTGERVQAGKLALAPRSITFLAIPSANDSACR